MYATATIACVRSQTDAQGAQGWAYSEVRLRGQLRVLRLVFPRRTHWGCEAGCQGFVGGLPCHFLGFGSEARGVRDRSEGGRDRGASHRALQVDHRGLARQVCSGLRLGRGLPSEEGTDSRPPHRRGLRPAGQGPAHSPAPCRRDGSNEVHQSCPRCQGHRHAGAGVLQQAAPAARRRLNPHCLGRATK